jgi:hypothetical protein
MVGVKAIKPGYFHLLVVKLLKLNRSQKPQGNNKKTLTSPPTYPLP